MKGRSVSALSAIVLLLLSMVLNTSAYGRVGSNWRSTLPKVGSFVSTLKQNLTHKFVTGLAAATIVCSASSCSVENMQNDAQLSADEIAVLTGHDRSTSLDEIIAAIEQTKGAKVGIIRNVDEFETGQVGELTTFLFAEAIDDTVLLKLFPEDVLVNIDTPPLAARFQKDEGLIAEGSPIAIGFFWGTAIVFTGLLTWAILEGLREGENLKDMITHPVPIVTTALILPISAGVYQLLVWL